MRRLWILLALPLFASAASHGLWAPDEPRYAEVAREVFVEPGLLVMRLCGDLYPDKPPLLFWLAGLLGKLSNWSPFWMRLVSILATLGTAGLISRLAGRWWGAREAALAPALFLGTAMVTEIGGRLQIDPLLCFLILAALVLFEADGDDPERGAPGHRWRRRLAGVALGFGMLAKGPIAVLIPLMVLGVWRLSPAARPVPRSTTGRGFDWLAALFVVAPVALWAGLAILSEPELAGPLLFGQHLGRLTEGGGGNHWAPPWQHLTTLPLLALPWTLVFVLGLGRAKDALRGRLSDSGLVRAALWFAVLFVFFSVIPPKRNLYLLPAYPALALVAARAWTAGGATRFAKLARSSAPLVLALLGLVVATAGGLSNYLAGRDPAIGKALAELPDLAGSLTWRLPLGAAPLVIGGLVGLWAVARERRDLAVRATLVGWGLGATALFALVFPGVDPVKSAERMAGELASLHASHPARVIPCLGIKPEGFRFYGGVPTVSALSLTSLDFATLPPPGVELEGFLLGAWADELGPDFLGIVQASVWSRFPDAVRAEFLVLREDRLGSKPLVVLGRR